jgi:hypothetical protein
VGLKPRQRQVFFIADSDRSPLCFSKHKRLEKQPGDRQHRTLSASAGDQQVIEPPRL